MMYAQSTDFSLKLSVERIKKHIAWRNNIEYHNFFGKEDKALKILQDGLIYQFGRDKEFRPIIVYNLQLIRDAINSKEITLQQFIRGMSYLLTSIRINMFLKYHVENWLIILDVQNMGALGSVSYTHLRAHETGRNLVCRLLLEKKKQQHKKTK
eukprot:TRINITY_DN9595_c0_g1_i1.p1 TRINITY_DN9595_c0_g1~~TRINITY_DN9595_c0_g1_i1.p1  ORF type:complete len:154 (+),score=17.18 TRINITY_DN9595_c0_g1_i1:313-774(+)